MRHGRGVCRGDQQQRLHLFTQAAAPVEKGALHPCGQRQLVRQRLDPVQLVGTELGRQLQQRKRVPAGVSHQPVGNLRRQHVVEALVEELTGGHVIEAANREHVEPARGEHLPCGLPGARGEDHGDRVCRELSGCKQKRVRRR